MKQKEIIDFINENDSDRKKNIIDGWKKVKLNEISNINPSKREIQNITMNIDVSFIPMRYIDEVSGTIIQQDIKKIDEIRKKGYKYFKEGDVLFARITPCMENGKCVIANNLTNKLGFGSTEYHVIRPKSNVLAKWIQLFLRQQNVRNEAKRHFTGSVGHQRVPESFLKNLQIPLPFSKGQPDLLLQQKIVERIEGLFGRLEYVKKTKNEIIEITKSIQQSIINYTFSKIDNIWTKVKLGDISDFKNGINFSAEQKGSNGILTIDVLNMYSKNLKPKLDNLYRVDINLKDDFLLKNGDILFVRSSVKKEGVAWTTVFTEINEPVTFCGFITRARLTKEKIIPEFLAHYFRSSIARNQLINSSSQVIITNINQKSLNKVVVPIPYKDDNPDVETQWKYVEFFNKLAVKQNNLFDYKKSLLLQIENLEQSILHKAFKGELVRE